MSFVLIPHPDVILSLRKIQNKFIADVNKNLHKPSVFPSYPLWLPLEIDSLKADTAADSADTLKLLKGNISEIFLEKIEVENISICFLCSYFLGKNKLCGKIKFAFFNRGSLNGSGKNQDAYSTAHKTAIETAEKMSSCLPEKIKIFELGTASFNNFSWQTEKTVWVKK